MRADANRKVARCFVEETLVTATMRDAGPVDTDAVEAARAAVAAEGEWIGAELPLRTGWGDRFRARSTAPESSWFVAEVGGHVVGGVFVQDTHGVAQLEMAVLESNRGAGLGRSLLNAAVGWARDRGCYKVTPRGVAPQHPRPPALREWRVR